MRIFFLIVFLFNIYPLLGQGFSRDYLQTLTYEELLTLFNKHDRDTVSQEFIARTYLDRARQEKDTIKMARGYDRLARIFHPERNITFADSIIFLTQHLQHKTYPSLGYMIKGFEFYRVNNLKEATENFLKSYEISLENKNLNHQAFNLSYLIFLKSLWGNKKEALELQIRMHQLIYSQEYLDELKGNTREGSTIDLNQLYKKEKINSFENYVFCYLNLRELDSASFYLKLGINELKDYKWVGKESHQLWFIEAATEINYFKGNYKKSLFHAEEILKNFRDNLDPNSFMNIFFFKGLALKQLGRAKEGIAYLKKADSIYENAEVVLQPFDRNLFEELLTHYTEQKDLEKQIAYLNKLIKIDSVFKINYQYFEPDMIKRFETPRLIKEKETLIASLELQNKKASTTTGWIVGILCLLTVLLAYYINKQQLYKKRFKKILEEKNGSGVRCIETESGKNEISSEVVEEILMQLERFERKRQFLSSSVSLNGLAKAFGTNPNYLSRVVNLKLQKNFSNYVNDLRVDYAVNELLVNPKFRKFTIKAIANECGFNSGESFSRAFYKKNRIYPSFYLKSLDKITG